MIIAALDTGMRRGEMLALRYSDIDSQRRLIVLRGATTKSRRTRVVPIGTSRLLAVLEWLRLDADGEPKSDNVLVFSNDEVGEALKTFRTAWVVAVLKAHGVQPHWQKGSYKDLNVQCRLRLREINLHWHDLRHEYASRLVERGVPLAQVRDLLGHASIRGHHGVVIGTSGKLYLAAILDLFSRFIVGWAVSAVNDRHLTIRALEIALKRRGPARGLLHHSDQGCTYASEDYQALLDARGIVCSMSRRGNCHDNAVMESFFSTVKSELADQFASNGDAKMELFDYIEMFYNQRRRHSTLGQVSPAAFERRAAQAA